MSKVYILVGQAESHVDKFYEDEMPNDEGALVTMNCCDRENEMATWVVGVYDTIREALILCKRLNQAAAAYCQSAEGRGNHDALRAALTGHDNKAQYGTTGVEYTIHTAEYVA